MSLSKAYTFSLIFDLESDHGYHNQESYEAFQILPSLIKLLDHKGIKATWFATGIVLEKFGPTLKKLLEEGHELGIHSYAHRTDSSLQAEEDLKKSFQTYLDTFNIQPKGYHPPYGKFQSPKEKEMAAKLGLDYVLENAPSLSSSPIKTLSISKHPFLHLPFGMGYINLIGLLPFKSCIRRKTQRHINIYLHLHDLINTKAYHQLPLFFKIFYLKNRFSPKMIKTFETFLDILKQSDYEAKTLHDTLLSP